MGTIDITYRAVKELVDNKLVYKTDDRPYEELSEYNKKVLLEIMDALKEVQKREEAQQK